jgi:hypothetical protein
MPYRRLPNTDTARLKAMKQAVSVSMKVSPYDLAFTQQTLLRLKSFLPLFEQSIQRQKQAYKNQVERSKTYGDLTKKARLYISHFFQVMNMMITRNELPDSTRTYYGLLENSKNIPGLSTEAELIEWGAKIIDGDQQHRRDGGKMITNPTAAIVRVYYEQFKEAHIKQKDLQRISNQTLAGVAAMREQADEIILLIWNEVEAAYENQDDDTKRQQAIDYGLKYVYRPSEKKKMHSQKLNEARMELLKEAKLKEENSETLSEENQLLLFNRNN